MAPLVVPKQLNKAKTFLDSVLAKLPEGDREAVRSQYSQAQDELASVASELDTAIGTVNATAERQAGWYAQHKDVIEGRVKVAPVGADGNVITNAVDKDALMKDVTARIDASTEELSRQGLYLTQTIPMLIAQHGVEFGGEVLDIKKVTKEALAAGMDLEAYYHQSVRERREVKAKTKYDADIAAAKLEGRNEGLKEAGNGHIPYPVGNRAPTTLSGLRKPADAAAASPYTLEAAVATAVAEMAKQS